MALSACDEDYANESDVVIDFLSQFESIFVPKGIPTIDGIMLCWFTFEPIDTDLPHFSLGSTEQGQPAHFDRFGNEIPGELLPFIRDFEIATFIAINFSLYDMGYGNMPAIVVAFSAMDTWGRSVLYLYTDGEYVEVEWGTFIQFWEDQYGNIFVAGDHGLIQIDGAGNVVDRDPEVADRIFTHILPRRDWRDEIRETVIEQHFPELARQAVNENEAIIDFLSQFESMFVPIGVRDADGIVLCWCLGQNLDCTVCLEPINTDLPHFSISSTETDMHHDRFGNEIAGELLPSIREFGTVPFIAFNFRLYDLGYGNMPAIVVAFSARETWGRMVLYRYIDGQFTEVLWGTYFGFANDDYGNTFVFGDHGVMHIDGFGNIGDLDPFYDDRILTTISHLPDLWDKIRQSIIERYFPEIAR